MESSSFFSSLITTRSSSSSSYLVWEITEFFLIKLTFWKVAFCSFSSGGLNKGSKYLIDVQFFDDYPVSNPKFTFKTKIYHCNVKDNGELNVNWMMKGMKIDYIMPRLLTLFYLQDTSVDENSEKSKLYKENQEEFKNNIKKSVEENIKEKVEFTIKD